MYLKIIYVHTYVYIYIYIDEGRYCQGIIHYRSFNKA